MLKIAHRGAKGYKPENTLAAFTTALEMKADGIELDIQLSTDGVLVVFHDETLDRLTNGTGLVSSFSLQELKTYRIANEHPIPTLKEVLELVNQKCLLNIEIKNSAATALLISLIEEFVTTKNWKYDSFIISSFDWNALQQIHNSNPKIPIGILTETNLDLAISFANNISAKAIHPHFTLLNPANTKKIQDHNLLVFPWTVNEQEDLDRLKTYNVNGIITDFTDRI